MRKEERTATGCCLGRGLANLGCIVTADTILRWYSKLAVRGFRKRGGVDPVRLPARSPNLNAFAERFVLIRRSPFAVGGSRARWAICRTACEGQPLGADPMSRAAGWLASLLSQAGCVMGSILFAYMTTMVGLKPPMRISHRDKKFPSMLVSSGIPLAVLSCVVAVGCIRTPISTTSHELHRRAEQLHKNREVWVETKPTGSHLLLHADLVKFRGGYIRVNDLITGCLKPALSVRASTSGSPCLLMEKDEWVQLHPGERRVDWWKVSGYTYLGLAIGGGLGGGLYCAAAPCEISDQTNKVLTITAIVAVLGAGLVFVLHGAH